MGLATCKDPMSTDLPNNIFDTDRIDFPSHLDTVHFHKAAFNNELGHAPPPCHAPRTDGWMDE